MDEPVPSTSPAVSPRKGVKIGFLPEVEEAPRGSTLCTSSRLSRTSEATSISGLSDRASRRLRFSQTSVSGETTEGSSHESQMNLAALKELRKAFEAADTDGTGGLDEEEFVKAFKNIKALSKGMDEQQMTHLFMKIDANSDGTVDWVEFTDYILLQQLALSDEAESGDHTYVKQRIPRTRADADEHARRDVSPQGGGFLARGGFALAATMTPLIQKIGHLPGSQQYITASQDGLLKLWSPQTVQPSRTINNGPAWITDMQISEELRTVAVFGMDRSLSFYSTARLGLDKVGRISDLQTIPTTTLWVPGAERERLLYGDENGCIHELQFAEEWGSKPGAPAVVADHMLPGVTSSPPWHVHQSWVTRMKYISHSASLLSCSMDGYLDMLDCEKRAVKWSAKEHQKGVHACDFCRTFNFIVTCGVERQILLWSPYSARPIASLQGHSAPVMDIVVNESEAQIISLASDNVIKVWDLRSNRCIQTLTDSSPESPTITALFQNPKTHSLVAGGMSLQQWNQKKAKEVVPSHVCTAIYNNSFRQLIIAEEDGAIGIWDVDDGERVFTFNDPLNKASKISSAALDHTERRLIVGGQDGSVRAWNFNSGACLKMFHGFGDSEVTCVASVNEIKSSFVAAAGWKAQLCVWEDTHSGEGVSDFKLFTGHTDDVSCMVEAAPGQLATGGNDGKVIIWKMDGGIRATLKRSDSSEADALKRTSVLSMCPLPSQAQTLAVASTDGKVAIWRIADAAMVYLLDTGHSGVLGPMATTLDNKTLFTSDTFGTVRSWDLSSGSFKRRTTNLDAAARRTSRRQVTVGPMRILENFCIQAEEGEVVGVAVMDTGQMMLTASACGSCRIWTSNGAPVGRFGQEKTWNLKDSSTWLSTEPAWLKDDPELNEKDEDSLASKVSYRRGLTLRRLGSLLRAGSAAGSVEDEEEFSDEDPGISPSAEEEIVWTVEEQVAQFLDSHKKKTGASNSLQKLTPSSLQVKELAPVDRDKRIGAKGSLPQRSKS